MKDLEKIGTTEIRVKTENFSSETILSSQTIIAYRWCGLNPVKAKHHWQVCNYIAFTEAGILEDMKTLGLLRFSRFLPEVKLYEENMFRFKGEKEAKAKIVELLQQYKANFGLSKQQRNALCRCGSGIKFKKCCLGWSTQYQNLQRKKDD